MRRMIRGNIVLLSSTQGYSFAKFENKSEQGKGFFLSLKFLISKLIYSKVNIFFTRQIYGQSWVKTPIKNFK